MSSVRPVMRFPLSRVVSALEERGLLIDAAGDLPELATGIADDSRKVVPGSLFVAVRGSTADGHDFLHSASVSGAIAAVVENAGRTSLPSIRIRDGRLAAAVAAAAAYDNPARSLTIAGVTGTNGKTTTVGILRHLLSTAGSPGSAASIGTLGVLGGDGSPLPGGSGLTTPGPVELQRVLRELVDRGVRHVVMEASSHSIHQRRIAGLQFACAVFTNLTRDHLDYHGDMESYLAAKASLVTFLAANGSAVVNADDPAWNTLPEAPHKVTYGRTNAADVRAEELRLTPSGSRWILKVAGDRQEVALPLVAEFNVDNALAAAAAAWSLGMSPAEIAERLTTLPQVPGRLERLAERPAVYRDYAHTPDALERALHAVRGFTPGRLIVVFGCGGDRDRGKRPEMGRIASELADLSIVTSDNPRTEDPERILDDIEAGMGATPHLRIEDRHEAIAAALREAHANDDLVLLAGKGHETYQLRGGKSYPFDEREIVRDLLNEAEAL